MGSLVPIGIILRIGDAMLVQGAQKEISQKQSSIIRSDVENRYP